MQLNESVLLALIETIAARRHADASHSYVAKMLRAPVKKSAQKVAEEGAEVAIAAVSESNEALRAEMADLLFHLLILCEKTGISFADVVEELHQRRGISGLDEKSARQE